MPSEGHDPNWSAGIARCLAYRCHVSTRTSGRVEAG